MSIIDVLNTLRDSQLARIVGGDEAGSAFLFPIIETVHVLALATVFGSIVMVDLRLLGLNSRDSQFSRLSAEVLPWTWTAFVLAAISGSLMFLAKAPTYWANTQFELKFLAMALAGINMLVFQFGAFKHVKKWDSALPPPVAARVAGALSIILWTTVIFMGRWVGFTT